MQSISTATCDQNHGTFGAERRTRLERLALLLASSGTTDNRTWSENVVNTDVGGSCRSRTKVGGGRKKIQGPAGSIGNLTKPDPGGRVAFTLHPNIQMVCL